MQRARCHHSLSGGAGRSSEERSGPLRTRWLGHVDDLVRADGVDVLTCDQATKAASAPQAAARLLHCVGINASG